MGRTNGIRIPCRTSARNTFPIPAMRLWSSKAATPHSVTRRQDLHFLCSALRTAYLASSRTPPAFLLTKALDHFRRMQIRCIRSAG